MLRPTLFAALAATALFALGSGCARGSNDAGSGGGASTTTTTTNTHVGGAAGNAQGGGGAGATGGTGGSGSGNIVVANVDYPVIAHGGHLVVSGNGFTGATAVKIGNVSVPFAVDTDSQVTLASVPDGVPVGAQTIVVSAPGDQSNAFGLTVIHLLVNELDCNQALTDSAEFVEISAGVPNVSLTGYTLVFWGGQDDTCYYALDLAGTTNAAGLLVTGNAGVTPAPVAACQWPSDLLQNGEDAVGIYQADVSEFVLNLTPANAAHLIDALVYDTADPDAPTLLDTLLAPAGDPKRVQVDEGPNTNGGISETQSIQRCGDGRRDGRKFAVGAPSAGAANTVAPCP